MNPIYTGKDVSYIDTKQANRAAENAVLDAERFAVFAGLLGGATYPRGRAGQGLGAAGLRRAPRRHHRLGVRPGVPRSAHRLARRVGARPHGAATTRWRLLSTRRRRPVVVWNPLAHNRTDVVTVRLDAPLGAGAARHRRRRRRVPRSSSTAGSRSAGWRATCRRWAGGPTASSPATRSPDWEPRTARDRQRALPAAGGSGAGRRGQLADRGRAARTDRRRRVGNELAVYDEYPAHPVAGEGPWHLLPKGRWSRRRPTGSGETYRSVGRTPVVARSDRRCCGTPRP